MMKGENNSINEDNITSVSGSQICLHSRLCDEHDNVTSENQDQDFTASGGEVFVSQEGEPYATISFIK